MNCSYTFSLELNIENPELIVQIYTPFYKAKKNPTISLYFKFSMKQKLILSYFKLGKSSYVFDNNEYFRGIVRWFSS